MSSASCSICMSAVEEGDAAVSCPDCASPYHADCWTDNGGCAVYGCASVPKTEGLKALEIPPAFWGREDKDCPRCGAKIMAVAVRCRHCGAEVVARPEEKVSYEKRAARRERSPVLRRAAKVFLVLSLFPGLSLITLIGGWIYYRRNREEIRRLTGGTEGLYRIAIATATAQVTILTLGVTAWWIKFAVLS